MPDGATSRPRALGREAAVIVAYLALTLVATYPLIRSFRTAIPPGGDTLQFYWNLWWVKRAIVDLHTSPLFTPDLYFPHGASLYFHTLNLLPSVLAIPIVMTLGLPAAYNTLVLLTFTFSGYGVYRLARYVLAYQVGTAGVKGVGNLRLAAFVAGVAFTFSSYRFAHLHGHLDLLSTQWLPFFVLFALKSRDEKTLVNPLLCGTFLAATALTSFYYLLFLLVFTAMLAVHTITTRRRAAVAALGRIAVALGTFALLVSPVLVPMLIRGRTEGRTLDAAGDMVRFSTDLFAFILPSPLHPLWGRAMAAEYGALFGTNAGSEQVAFLGYVTMLLAAAGCRLRTLRNFWLPAALVFGALALGPITHAGGRALPALSPVMPYRLIAQLPYGDIPRVPVRFVVMAQLCASMLAAAGLWSVLRHRSAPQMHAVAAAVVALSIFENAAAPVPVQSIDTPPLFARLRAAPERRAVLEMPIPDDPSVFPSRMLFQTMHEHPVYQGYVSRGFPPLPFGAVPGFAQFKTLSPVMDDIVAYEPLELRAVSRRVLAAYGAGHVVIEKGFMSNPGEVDRARRIADDLLGASSLEYEDAFTLAYTVPRDAGAGPPVVWLEAGWSYSEHVDRPPGVERWRWMSDRSRVAILADAPGEVRMMFNARAFGRVRRLRLAVAGTEVATLPIVADRRDYETPAFHVPAGVTFVDLESLDGSDTPGADPRRLSVALFQLRLNNP